MTKRKSKFAEEELAVAPTAEQAAAVAEDTAAIELEKLQRKLAREERKKRREIEAASQKKAIWLLPSLLFVTMMLAWMLGKLKF